MSARGLVGVAHHYGHAIYSMLCKAVCCLSHCAIVPSFKLFLPSTAGQCMHRYVSDICSITHMHIGLDNHARCQLNRVEAMLHALCARHGIEPSTLPGYEAPRPASLSTHSLSSVALPIDTPNPSDVTSEPGPHTGRCICVYDRTPLTYACRQGKGWVCQRTLQRRFQCKLTWVLSRQGMMKTTFRHHVSFQCKK